MALNVVVLAFCLLLGWVAVRFGKPRAKGPRELRRLALVFGVLLLFLLGNGLMAWLGRRALAAVLSTPPVTTGAELAAVAAGHELVAVGRLSPTAKSDDARYGAYVHCWSGCEYHGPLPLPVDLEGGSVGVVNSDYETRQWPVRSREAGMSDGESVTYLEPESPLVVVGALRGAAAGPSPSSVAEVTALVVFAGSYDAFVERAERRLNLSTILLSTNAIAAMLALAIGASLALARGDETA